MHCLPIAKKIVATLVERGFVSYFVGGWVRDYLLHHPSEDIDLVTSASVEEVVALFPKTIPLGVHFGIVIVVEEGHHFEVATFRKEQGYHDGRRPTSVARATPEEDARRRDFTINGIFYDPIHEITFDYVGGKKDLAEGIIRAIGNPHERFLEDRLRMIRAVRYATRFGFSIEPATLQAILDHAQALFPAVAIERVWHELVKMNRSPHFPLGLIMLHHLHLLPVIFPALQHISVEEISKRLCHLEEFPADAPLIAKILELFPGFSLHEKEELLSYLKRSNQDKSFVITYHHAQEMCTTKKEPSLFDWAYLYANPDSALSLQLIAIHLPPEERALFYQSHSSRKKSLELQVERIEKKKPLLTSSHLREAGIQNGKRMGILLHEGEKISINERLTDPQEVVRRLQSSPFWKGLSPS